MDNIVDRLLQNSLNTPKFKEKAQSVLESSQEKQPIVPDLSQFDPMAFAANQLTGRGYATRTSLENDLATLSNNELRTKYGQYGDLLISERDKGTARYVDNASRNRIGGQAHLDNAIDFGSAAVNAVGGMAALAAEGLSHVDVGQVADTLPGPLGVVAQQAVRRSNIADQSVVPDNASLVISEALDKFSQYTQGLQSDALNRARENHAARMSGSNRDSLAQYQEEGDGFTSSLKRIGREALDAVSSHAEDPMLMSSGLSQAAGSLVVPGVAGKGISSITSRLPGAQKIVKAAKEAREAGEWTAARAAHSLGQSASGGSVIAAMETGGVYMEVTNRIMEKSHEELMETSPFYRKVFEQVGDIQQAKEITARTAARKAAKEMAPIAAGTGLLVGRFEANPIARNTIRGAAQNTVGQTFEEAVQGTAGAITGNRAMREYVDPNTDVLAGAGEGAGLGALYGLGISTAVQTPGVALQKVYDGTNFIKDTLTKRVEEVNKKIQERSPVSTQNLAPIATEITQKAEEIRTAFAETVAAMPEEQQPKASEYVERLLSLGSFTEGQYQDPTLNEITAGSTSKLEALQKIGEVVANPNADPQTRLLGALEILLTQDHTLAVASSDATQFSELSDDSPAAMMVNGILELTQRIISNPEVAAAVQAAQQIIEQPQLDIAPVTEESLNTPEGQRNIDTAIKVAQVAPEKGNLEANQQILYHAAQGTIQLSPAQIKALEVSSGLIQAERNSQQMMETLNLSDAALSVNKQITIGSGKEQVKGDSLAQHAKKIYRALMNQDNELAEQHLADLGGFVQTLLNKAEALNKHIQAGPKSPHVGYEAWNPNERVMYKVEDGSKGAMFYMPNSPKSNELARTIMHEATLAADVFNNMAKAVGSNSQVTPPTVPTVLVPNRVTPTQQAQAESTPAPKEESKPEPKKEAPVVEPVQSQKEVQAVKELEKNAPKAEESVTPSVTTTQAKKLSDSELNDQLNSLLDIPESDRSPVETATLGVLDAEMTAREDQAAIELARQEVEENQESVEESAQDTTSVVEPETVVEAPQTETPVVELKGTAAVFPDLIGTTDGTNLFVSSFNYPKNPKSNIAGSEQPIATIKDLIWDSEKVGEMLGESWSTRLDDRVSSAWSSFINLGRDISKNVANRFDKEINNEPIKKDKKGNKTKRPSLLAQLNEGKPVNRWVNGLLFNIAERFTTPKGRETAVLNQNLLQTASLATLDWVLNTPTNEDIDHEDAVGIVRGMFSGEDSVVETVHESAIMALNSGSTPQETIRTLGSKIVKYWGLQANRDGFIGDQQGIPESLARMFLEDLISRGYITPKRYAFINTDGVVSATEIKDSAKGGITIVKWEINPENHLGLDESTVENLIRTRTLLERLITTEPEAVHYVGENNIPPAARTQLRKPLVPLTRQQKITVRKANEIQYKIDPNMVSLFGAFGKDQIVELFGGDDTSDTSRFNINNLLSVDGKRKGIASAYDALQDLLLEIQSVAQAEGKPIKDVAVRYAHEFNAVNRLMLKGGFNPQSSKLMREAVLPTRVVADLTNEKNNDLFFLSLAQGLGIKIEQNDPQVSIERVKSLLNGELSHAVELMDGALNNLNTDALLDQLPSLNLKDFKDAFKEAGVKFEFLSLKSLMEYSRYTRAEDLTQFESTMYIEVDGINNGPANAMMLFNYAGFTEDWVQNMERVGLYFSQPDAAAPNKIPNTEGLYEASAKAFVNSMKDYVNTREKDWQKEQANNIYSLLSMFSDDFGFNDDNEIEVSRNFLKNPLMVMIYGSTEGGVAGSVTKNLTDAIYERISTALQTVQDNPEMTFAQAMFPGSKDPNGDLNRFQGLLAKITRTPISLKNPQTFTINGKTLRNLNSSIKFNVVEPMYSAIQSTVGNRVFSGIGYAQTAIQVMSQYAKELQKELLDAQMEQYKEEDSSYSKRQLLKKKDLQEIEEKLLRVSAYIETAHQNFLVTKGNTMDTPIKTSESFNGGTPVNGTIQGFNDAGVAGAAYMNIGSGDAQMVQFGFTQGGSEMSRVLPAYDGMHFSYMDATNGEQTMNKAVWDSWMLNPMDGIVNAFERFLKEADPNAVESLMISVDPHWTGEGFLSRLKEVRDSIETNKKVVKSVQSRTNQMAAVGNPFENQGIEVDATSIESITEELNELHLEARKQPKVNEKASPLRNLLAPKGRPANWVQTIGYSALFKLSESDLLNQDQKETLRDLLNDVKLDTWKFHIGTPDTLKRLASRLGIGSNSLYAALNSGHNGFTIPKDRVAFIMNDSAETVLHEVIHASTFEKVLAHVNGTVSNPTVERIEEIMGEFMKLDVADYSHLISTSMALSQAQSVIQRALDQGDRAVAINEFMAWTLSNRELIDLTKTVKLPKYLQVLKDAWDALKVLIFGDKKAPRVGADMYSNLRFNTALLVNTNTTLPVISGNGPTLYHEASKIDPDLVALDKKLQAVIKDQLIQREAPITPTAESLSKEIIISLKAADAVAGAFFNMTPEENETFKTIVQALTVEQNLDRNFTREANNLYKEVVKNLKVEDFIPENADPSERAYANAKYNLITGTSFSEIDGAGRSTALAVFFGLAMTNKEFKDILKNMKMPKGIKSDQTGLDGALENFGYRAIDALGSKLAGTGHAKNIQEAMNILANKLMETQEERENRFEVPGRWIDRVNDQIVKAANDFAHTLAPELSDAEKAQRTKWEKGLAGFKAGLAAAISEDIGARVAEDVTAKVDTKENVPHWIRELLGDLVGRTQSNALIYDMIKMVRSTIQAIRQNYRVNLPKHIAKQFSRELSDVEWATLQTGITKTGIADLALLGSTKDDIRLWLSNDTARRNEITRLEGLLNTSKSGQAWIKKTKQLAEFMNTKKMGINLLSNAEAIVDLLGEKDTANFASLSREDAIKAIDALASLYAVDSMNQIDKANLASLVQNEKEGVDYILSYTAELVKAEKNKLTDASKYNAIKGFIPFEQKPNTSLIVAHESQYADKLAMGYTPAGQFVGANAHLSRGFQYFRMDASAKAAFNQGIIQTARATVFGVDPSTGYSINHVVQRITDPVLMRRLLARQDTDNTLRPVYDAQGKLRAVEQLFAPEILETVQEVPHIANTIGKWKGRQEEEALSKEVNKVLVDRLKDIYQKDENKDRYEDIFKSKDPVIQDALNMIPRETLDYIKETFGNEFMVQRNMLRDVLGYRDASIRDSWTGETRMSKETQDTIRKLATGIIGADAYKKLVKAEEIIENLTTNAKLLIAVKSGIVPALNIISNLVHLVSRGTPIKTMVKGIPLKLAEIREYTQSRIQYMELEADYAAATQPNQRASIEAQMRAIEDSHRRMSIWPLIEAGEFTAISDVDLRDADNKLVTGKWAEYFDEAVAKLPEGVNTAGRYFLVSKDTVLFNGLQKAVEYGDLIAKAVLYDDLTTRVGKSKEEALGIITEEFVNYDRLPGRARGKLEKIGLAWFYNFKLRSVKVALSTIRNNPLHTLLALGVPTDFGIGDAGIPVEDNAVTMALENRLWYSLGPGQGFRAPALNPWVNLMN